MKKIIFLLSLILFFQNSIAQTNSVYNPSFEDKHCCPSAGNDPDPLFGPTSIPCVDAWTEPSRSGALCGVGTTDYANICDWLWHPDAFTTAYPRTSDGYIHLITNEDDDYHEYLTQEFSPYMVPQHLYYVEFYVRVFDGTEPAELRAIGARFSNTRPEQCHENRIGIDNWNYVGNPTNRVLTSSLSSRGWLKITGYFKAVTNYNWITIGDFIGGYGGEHVTIEDVAIYHIGQCNCANECSCIDIRKIENTWYRFSEPVIEASNYIRAGYDVGAPSINGDDIVEPGSDITYRAGNYISLEPGFIVENGATFTAAIQGCATSVTPNSFSILNQPDVFTPNGDGVNDQLCYPVVGVQNYLIKVWDRWGIQKYEGSGSIPYSTSTSTLCVWDGSFNMNGSGPPCNDVYDVIVTFSNCASSTTLAYDVTILGTSPCRLDLSKSEYTAIDIYPNPTSGTFRVEVNGYAGEKEIFLYDMVGKEALKVITLPEGETNTEIDLSLFPKGIYFVKIKTGEIITIKKVIYI